MSAKVIRHMSLAKASIVVFAVVALFTAGFMLKLSQGAATPNPQTVGSKVPHYFGPNPNWALSPLTLPDATVTVTTGGSHDVTATAQATVGFGNGANGVVTGITITNPGAGYTTADVVITGAGSGAAASAVVTTSTAVTAVNVTNGGALYTKPVVSFSGGSPTTTATATAYGGVDAVTLSTPGIGYTFPTVDFDAPDDPNGTQATAHAEFDAVTGAITAVIVDTAGSGYSSAPGMVIRDGTIADPINNAGSGATAKATLKILSVGLDTFGAGYTSAPLVHITDATGVGAGATATSVVNTGTIASITVTNPGSGYVTPGGIKKFQDDLPGLCDPASVAGCPTTGKYIPLGVPEVKKYLDPNGKPIAADEYEIGLVQYRTNFSSSLPDTLVRGYVQLETPSWLLAHPGVSQHFPLANANLDPTKPDAPILINGTQAFGVTRPQWLGPTLAATKAKPVRVVFHNLLPNGVDGNLFIPTDTTLMGSGDGPIAMPAPVDNGTVTDEVRNPVCTDNPQDPRCFKQNRATLHMHGGITPWISDGTPHQWITPANENTPWPQGVDVQNVPDMSVGNDARDGIQTFYYTNQQSARLMFYHDHAWGITRLNVYAGEAAGYLISDNTEKTLINNGTIPGPADTIPLVVQDRTFVPKDTQIYDTVDATGTVLTYGQDPAWDSSKWGSYGNFWYHHVYMPAQNPGSPSGMSSYGRWMYGPWFWPPASNLLYGPIANPFYNASCNLDNPATWQYQVAPYCEPKEIPGTPNISTGMEQFNDTPIVNGVAYPKVTLAPKSYRFRLLNAANDRFFNLQWYVADPRTGTLSEVALKQSELNAAQTDPNVFPTPDTAISAAGPDWIQIGTEGGFLPAPTVVNGHQPITWITDPSRFDFGNVDKHSLVMGPAERADVIVDFSQYAGKTLILYNDAPAAYPARMPSYDYYTGTPNLSPTGAPGILPGYGPNTRTVMQVTISGTPAPAFNLVALRSAFGHKANGSGVFESGQNPIIVGQAAYNSAYGTSFAGSSNCNPIPNDPNPTFQVCDGFVRVNDTLTFGFNTLKKPTTKTIMALQPKASHDEMNATAFDNYGRMQATLGVEAQPPTPAGQNVTLYPFINPSTELIDGTNLPKEVVAYDADGNPVSDIKITAVSTTDGTVPGITGTIPTITDGTQIWRITHNGVDTHPFHFHLFDVQIINRVTWDNIIIPTEPSELGWKDTIRVSPLEDTIVAVRPVIMDLPWELPNAIRDLNPGMPTGSTAGFNNVDPAGNPTTPITNVLVNFGWEYVYHCHILTHEEMDMMRPVTLAVPPVKANGLSFVVTAGKVVLTWNDNSISETAFVVQRTTDGTTWTDQGTIVSPLDQPNIHEIRTFTDPAPYNPNVVYAFRIVAQNTVGYGNQFPGMTVQSLSDAMLTGPPPAAPTSLTATAQAGPQVLLHFTDNAIDETGFTIERAVNGGAWAVLTSLPAHFSTGAVNYIDTAVSVGNTYDYRVRADKGAAASAWSNTATVTVPYTITPTAGANGSVTPSAPTAVLPGGSQAFTIMPNSGYHVLDVLVDGGTVGAVTSYTFNNVAANHTISATFETNAQVITVTAPPAGGSYAQYTSLSVAWTTGAAVSVGQFGVWADSGSGWYIGQIVPTNGTNSYTTTVTLNVPVGASYRIAVGYRPSTSGAFTTFAWSPASFGVTAAAFNLTVTAPPAGGSYAQYTSLPVAWTTGATVAAGGQFAVWADSGSGWYIGQIVPTDGTNSYATNVTLNVPVGASYSIAVGYRPTTSGAFTAFAWSPGSFGVTAGAPAVVITVPAITGTHAQLSSLPVTWTTAAAVPVGGQFAVWADSGAGWYIGKVVPADGTSSYATTVTLSVPLGSTYSIWVGYRPTAGVGAFTTFGQSSGTFTVN